MDRDELKIGDMVWYGDKIVKIHHIIPDTYPPDLDVLLVYEDEGLIYPGCSFYLEPLGRRRKKKWRDEF